jgi:hypothetical protein
MASGASGSLLPEFPNGESRRDPRNAREDFLPGLCAIGCGFGE